MQELVKISHDARGKPVVSARELYHYLEVGTIFTTWCKRMFEYGFEEGKDFIPILEESNGGRPSTDYALTLDTAKEISMIQRSEKGSLARKYFIECERRLQDQTKVLPSNFKQALLALVEAEEEKERLAVQAQLQAQELIKQAPKVEYHDSVLQSETLISTNLIAKELGMSAIALNRRLKEQKVIYVSGNSYVLYAKYQNMGFTGTKTHIYRDSLGQERTSIQTYWTEKGRQFIHNLLKQ